MTIDLGTAILRANADLSGLSQGLAQGEREVQGWADRMGGSIQRVGEVALGILVARAIPKVIEGFTSMAREAIGVTAELQQMQIGIEGLLAREIAKGAEVIQTRQVRVQLTAAEAEKLSDLNLQRNKLNAQMQEETERHRQLVAKWGAEGLAVQTHAASMAILQDKIEDTSASIATLEKKQGGLATVTEKMRVGTMTLAEAMPQAQAETKALMDELSRIAILSPYQLEYINSTFKQAMAFGYTSKEATKFTQAMLNVAAGVGAGNEQLGRMSYNFAQIRMIGKVTRADIRQLAMAGFDLVSVLQFAGEKYKVAIQDHEDFNAAVAAGKITWEQFTEAFAEYADANFGGASERMARSLAGLQSTFQDLFALTMPQVVGPAVDSLTGRLSDLLDLFLTIRESGVLEEFGKRLGAAIEGVLAPLDRLLKYLTAVREGQQGLGVAGAANAPNAQPDVLAGALQTMFGAQALAPLHAVREAVAMVANAFQAAGAAIARVWQTIQPLISFVADKVGAFVELRDVAAAFGLILLQAVIPALAGVVSGFLAVAAPVAAVIAAVALLRNAWEQNLGGIQEKVTTFGQAAGSAFETVKSKVGELAAAFQTGGLPAVEEKLGQWWQEVVTYVQNNATGWGEQIRSAIGAVWAYLTGTALPAVSELLGQWWGEVVAYVQNNASGWGEQLKQALAQLWQNLTTTDTGNFTQLTKFGQIIADIQAAFARVRPYLEAAAGALAGIGAAVVNVKLILLFAELGKGIASVWTVLADFKLVLSGLILAINPVTVAIAAVMAGFVALGAYLATHREQLQQLTTLLSNVFGPMLQRIKEAVLSLGAQFEAMKPALARFSEALTAVGTVCAALAAAVAAGVGVIVKLLGETLAAAIKNVEHIFGGLLDVVSGIAGTLAGIVIALVETIVGLFTGDFARAAEAWKAVWESFKTFLSGLVETLLGIVATLVEAIVNAIGDLIPGLAAKMQQFKEDFVAWIAKAIQAIKDWLGIASPSTVMLAIATDIVQGLIDGIGAMIENVKKKLGEIVQAVLDMFPKPLETLKQIGEDLITGFFKGITDAWGRAVEGFKALVNLLPAWAKRILGIASPSKVFEQIGELIIRGLQLGIAGDTVGTIAALTSHVTVIVAAFRDLANNVIAPEAVASAKAITDPLAEIMDNVVSIISGLTEFGNFKFGLDAGGVIYVIDVLATTIDRIVKALAYMANNILDPSHVHSAKAVTDPLAEIFESIQNIVDGCIAIAEYARMPRVDVAIAIGDLEYALGLLIPALDRVAAMVGDMGIAAGILAQNVGPAMATLRDAVETVASLATLAGTELSSDQIRGAVHTMIDNMGVMLYEIQYALNGAAEYGFVLLNLNDQIKKWLVDIQPVAQNLNGLVSAWTGIQQIAGFEPLQSDVLRKTVRRMIDQLGLVLYEIQYSLTGAAEYGFVLANLNDWIKGLLPEINAVAGNLSQLVGAWAGIRQVADLEPVSSDVLSTAIRQMVNQLGAVIYELQMLANQHPELLALNDELATSIAQLAELAQSFANLVTGALAALTALAVDVIIPEALVPKIAMIGLFAGRVAETLGVVAKCIDYRLLEKTREFAENASALFGLLQPALEAVELLAEDVVVPDMALIRVAAIGLFAGQVAQTLGVIAECIDYKLLAKTREFADNTGAVLGIIKTALETMTALTRKIELPDKLDGKLEALAEFIDQAVRKLGEVAEQIDDDLEDEAKNLSDAVTSVMGGLEAALELALSLPEEWAPPDPAVLDAFFNWATGVFESFVAKVKEWTTTQAGASGPLIGGEDDATVIGAVAQSFGQVMGGLKAALELALSVPKTWRAPDENTWDAFFAWAMEVYEAFVREVQAWTAEQEDPENEAGVVGAVGSAFGSVMQGLAAAFDVFTGLRTYVPVLQTQMDLFLKEVLYIYEQIAIFATGEGVAQATEAVGKFAEANQAIFGGLNDALKLFQELAESMPTDWETFIYKIVALLNRVIATFDGFVLAAEAAGEWTEAAQVFADALAMVVGVLSDALTLFQDLAENGAPNLANLETFLNGILGVFGEIGEGLAQTAKTAQETLQTVAALLAEGEIALRAWGKALAAAFVDEFRGTLTDAHDLVDATVNQLLGVAASYAIRAFADAQGKTVGVAIGQGFINGVISTAQQLADAIVAVINAGIGAAEYVLGVASPSKVFFGIGENVGSGLTGGVMAMLPGVKGAASALAGALGPVFGSGRLSAQVGVSSRRHIVVDFRGQAGGGVPMTEYQLERLKRELAYAIQLGG